MLFFRVNPCFRVRMINILRIFEQLITLAFPCIKPENHRTQADRYTCARF